MEWMENYGWYEVKEKIMTIDKKFIITTSILFWIIVCLLVAVIKYKEENDFFIEKFWEVKMLEDLKEEKTELENKIKENQKEIEDKFNLLKK